MSFLKIKKLHQNAKIPTRGSQYAAGYDLYAHLTDTVELQPNARILLKTGISMQIPEGYFGRIAPRSGLSIKFGINTLAGIIDSDYTGEIGIVLINNGDTKFIINNGDRVAQLIILKHYSPKIEVVHELEASSRGSGGFGSTGEK